jgi:hypothetical protein
MPYKRPPPLLWHAVSISDIVARVRDHEDEDNDYSTVLEDRFRSLEAEYGNAKTTADLDNLKTQLDAVEAERTYSNELTNTLHREVDRCKNGTGELGLELGHAQSPDDKRHYFTKESVYYWARNPPYEKEITKWEPIGGVDHERLNSQSSINNTTTKNNTPEIFSDCKWLDIKIALRAHNKIHVSSTQGKSATYDLEHSKFYNWKKKDLNQSGQLLLGLIKRHAIPLAETKAGQAARRTAVNRIRTALKNLIGISADPFYNHNPSDGWKARFNVVDRRKAADERASAKATKVPFDDNGAEMPSHEFDDTYTQEGDEEEYPYDQDKFKHSKDAMGTAFLQKHDK